MVVAVRHARDRGGGGGGWKEVVFGLGGGGGGGGERESHSHTSKTNFMCCKKFLNSYLIQSFYFYLLLNT